MRELKGRSRFCDGRVMGSTKRRSQRISQLESDEVGGMRAPCAAIIARRGARKQVNYSEAAADCEEIIASGGVGRRTAAKLQVVAAGRELVADDGRGGDTCGTRAIVHTLEASRKSLLGKKESRRSSVIDGLLPRGSGTLALRVPRRMHFCEGAEGDAAHSKAMRDVVSNF